ADFPKEEVLKTAGVLYDDVDLLITNCEFNVAATAAFAATLQDFGLVLTRLVDQQIPTHPVVQLAPIADGILLRLRFIADSRTLGEGMTGVQKDLPIRTLLDHTRAGIRIWVVVRIGKRH